MFETTRRDTSRLSIFLFRAAIFLVFIFVGVRLYQLQVIEGSSYRQDADNNRFDLIEVPPKRGVIYDRTGTILARNRPSFEVALVPEDLPFDDPETELDEEALAIEEVLHTIGADSDEAVALRIAEVLFLRLGRADFSRTVGAAGVQLDYVTVAGSTQLIWREDGNAPQELVQPLLLPDISKPLPMEGLVALVRRAITLERQGSASKPVPIVDLVTQDHAFEIEEARWRLPAVRVNEVPVREYTEGELVSHILGFMGPIPAFAAQDYKERGYTNPNERVGLNGLEYSYQRELRGIPGYKNVEVDILGREMRTVGEVAEAVPGSNLILNIDARLQRVMMDALQAKMTEVESPWGVAIAMNPMTGAVEGMVSLPSYDNNVFAEKINAEYLKLEADERRPLINYAIGGLYPPGSTFKMVTSAAALQEKVITPDTLLTDAGPIYLPNRFYPNDMSLAQPFVSWNHKYGIYHGPINVVQALALSNDIFFYMLGGGYPPTQFQGLGVRNLAKWTELFGYGPATGIDLPGEVGAVVPDDQWKRQLYAESWTTGDSYNMSIGQGFVLATPLQVLVSTAAVANGGKVVQPQVVYQITDAADGLQRDFTPRFTRELPLDDGLIEVVQQGMWSVVNAPNGTGYAVKLENPDIVVAGKTGTAEYCDAIPKEDNPEELDCRYVDNPNGPDYLPTHAWMVAYAPFEAPEIAVVVFVYDGGEGSAVAAPVAKTILEAYFNEIHPR
ncbi:MAG: penicillin-binding protein 2 [Caldilineaceae bacterium]|nr:penicillin-binding protein 2 [Caldilineaceae bacterium]